MKLLKGKYLLVLIAVCGMTAAGLGMLTNVSGLFFTPISEEMHVGRGSVSMTLTISNLISAVGGIIAAKHVRGTNLRKVMILCASVFAGCTALLAICNSLFPLYLLNAVRGFAAGVIGNVLITMMISNWYHTSTGLITSIAMGCSGLAGAAFSPRLSAVFQSAGWRAAYVVSAVIIFVLYIPAIFFPIAYRPDDLEMEPMGGDQREAVVPGETPVSSAVDSKLFLFAVIFAVLVAFISSFPPHMPSVATSYGFSPAVGSAMLSAALIANTGGKLLFGVLADRIGAKRSIFIYCIIFVCSTILLLFVRTSALMVPYAILFGVVYSLPTVALVLFVRESFGVDQYPRTYPKISMVMTIVNAFGTTIIGFLYDLTGNYTLPLFICMAVGLLTMLVTFLTFQRLKKKA